ncbi:MAG: hypothetical protein GY951_11045 [Psychromonas sp.]|nr:hypothetical protein [Psychromonas sp.]
MIYIHQVGCINYKETEVVDIKATCKLVAPKFIRRTDNFIQLAILGVEQIQQKTSIKPNCALYLTSGQGNLGVFQRLCKQCVVDKSPPKPVDFINSLSNTAGFYISQFLNLESKNSNLSHISFVVEMALLLAKSDLLLNKEEQILLGGVDQLLPNRDFSQATLGLSDTAALGQGSNWMLLSQSPEGALANISLTNIEMNKSELMVYLSKVSADVGHYKLGFSLLIEEPIVNAILKEANRCRFHYEADVGFYETVVFYALNQFVLNEKGKLIFIDYFDFKYRVITLDRL